MNALAQYFDHYVISARLKPAFFVVLPIAITAVVWLPHARQLGGAILTFLTTFGAISFISNLISNQGNKLQAQLFAEWGGAPSTALLRFSDENLDPYTKERYHRRLEALIFGLKMPTEVSEREKPSSADACYTSATNFLREHTRDKTKYSMIYTDNVAYGYARNLLTMKKLGLAFAALGSIINIALLYPDIVAMASAKNLSLLTQDSLLGLGALGVCLGMFWLFAFLVNREYVKGRAVRYAKSLLAACESSIV